MLTLRLLAVLAVLAPLVTNGFQTVAPQSSLQQQQQQQQATSKAVLYASNNDDINSSNNSKRSKFKAFRQSLLVATKGGLRKKAVAAVMVGAATGGFWNLATPQVAGASAPVMAVPKAEQRDPGMDAMINHQRKMVDKEQAELAAVTQKAREIESSQGEKARVKFEREYKAGKEQEAQERAEGLVKLKRSLLLDHGIDPEMDLEGERQVTLYEKGVDLGKVPGTMMYLEKQFEASNFKKSSAFKMEHNRRIVKAMAQDMDNKGIDIVEYFDAHKDKTQGILTMPPLAAAQMVAKYEANLAEYGQVNVPKEGEMSVKEKMEKAGGNKVKDAEAAKKTKEAAKAAKSELKAKAKAEKAAAKEAAKEEKAASKAAAVAAAASATAAASSAASAVQTAAGSAVEAVTAPSSGAIVAAKEAVEDAASEASDVASEVASDAKSAVTKSSSSKKSIPTAALVGVGVVAVGGGGYAFKVSQDKSGSDEAERQRQFRMLMGESGDESGPSSAPALELVDDDDDTDFGGALPEAVQSMATPPTAAATPAKKRRGFFGKKNKNGRPTNLNVFTGYEKAVAPEFASLLAKTLTYGAPGRFPSVAALPGDMPFTGEFELEVGKQQLIDSREEAEITLEESAEIFAGVVNCMLIEIVDFAATTLKSKDNQVTVDGISVVVDFMNHAASIYDSVAEGITINPVTYGGDLGKGQLEKMYSCYAGSGMMNMGDRKSVV